jgi:hypothetical protein
VTDDTGPTGSKRNDTGALLQLALAGIVLILLGLAASQARREPEPDAVEALQDSSAYDFDDAVPPDPDSARDTLPFDLPLQPDTALPDAPGFTPGAVP